MLTETMNAVPVGMYVFLKTSTKSLQVSNFSSVGCVEVLTFHAFQKAEQ